MSDKLNNIKPTACGIDVSTEVQHPDDIQGQSNEKSKSSRLPYQPPRLLSSTDVALGDATYTITPV